MPMSLFSLFGHGPSIASLLELYHIMLACLLGFFVAHWEKYNTGSLFLPWTYDASQLVSSASNNIVANNSDLFKTNMIFQQGHVKDIWKLDVKDWLKICQQKSQDSYFTVSMHSLLYSMSMYNFSI